MKTRLLGDEGRDGAFRLLHKYFSELYAILSCLYLSFHSLASWRITLPPKWVDTVDRVEEALEVLDKKMELLSALHTKRLMVTFDDSSEVAQERNIEASSSAITTTLRKAEVNWMEITWRYP